MADPALTRLAARAAEERSKAEAPPPYRPLIAGADVVDFGAYVARLRGDLVLPTEQAEIDEIAVRQREEETALDVVPCPHHHAARSELCRLPTRTAPRLVACDERLQLAAAALAQQAEAAQVEEREAIAVRLHESGVPGKLCRLVITNAWENREPLRQAQVWYPSKAGTLLLAGDTNAGKSAALAWLLSQPPRLHRHPRALRRFHESTAVLWVAAASLAAIMAWEEKGQDRPKYLWADLLEAPRLVVDDIGRVAAIGKDTTIAKRLSNLLGERIEADKDTYMTTNIARKAVLEAMLEPQVWHRLDGWCDIYSSKEPIQKRKRD